VLKLKVAPAHFLEMSIQRRPNWHTYTLKCPAYDTSYGWKRALENEVTKNKLNPVSGHLK